MTITIEGTAVGPGEPPLVVAEIGMNHNGDIELGTEMIRSAADAGADAVKFQSFRTDEFLSDRIDAREEYRKYQLSPDDHEHLKAEARDSGVTFLSTPFDRTSVDLLVDLGVPCFKIASSDLTNYPFLEYIAETGKPMILSTGYSSLSEVATAVETIRETGNDRLILLHCVSSYPTPPEDMNLAAMQTLREIFKVPVGLSDHTDGGVIAPVAATALGASVLEKHFTTDNDLPGFDHEMSTNPETFGSMVDRVHGTFEALGSGEKEPTEAELQSREGARRSLYWASDYPAGTSVDEEMIRAMRPGDGIPPGRTTRISGEQLSRPVEAGEQIQYGDIAWSDE